MTLNKQAEQSDSEPARPTFGSPPLSTSTRRGTSPRRSAEAEGLSKLQRLPPRASEASELASRHLLRDMIGLAQGQCHDCKRRIFGAPVVNWLPSETKRLLISCVCPNLLTTPSAGFSLIRLVPRLWVEG